MTTVSDADHAAWQGARTLSDVGELTALWLEGGIASQPGYDGGPADETWSLIPVLARLNRAGFVTTGSQPGLVEEGGGTLLEQCAAVEGFAGPHMATRLAEAAQAADLTIALHCPAELPRWRYRYVKSVAVTRVNGRDFTRFGVQLSRSHIRSPHLGYGICHRDAVRALCSAWQVTVTDPIWGRPGLLWDALRSVQPESRLDTRSTS